MTHSGTETLLYDKMGKLFSTFRGMLQVPGISLSSEGRRKRSKLGQYKYFERTHSTPVIGSKCAYTRSQTRKLYLREPLPVVVVLFCDVITC